jgi:hypothetical protein
LIQDHVDNRLGKIKVYQGPQESLIAVKKLFANNRDTYKEFLENNLLKSLKYKNRFLKKIYTFKVHTDFSLCS